MICNDDAKITIHLPDGLVVHFHPSESGLYEDDRIELIPDNRPVVLRPQDLLKIHGMWYSARIGRVGQ